MSLESVLRTALIGESDVTDLVDSRVHVDIQEQGFDHTLACVVINRIGTQFDHEISNEPYAATARIGFHCIARTRAEAMAIASAVSAVIRSLAGSYDDGTDPDIHIATALQVDEAGVVDDQIELAEGSPDRIEVVVFDVYQHFVAGA